MISILDEITGINVRIDEIVVAEVGTVVDRFPTEAQLVSWAGLCPEAKISAGKRLSTKTGKGNRWLRQALIEAAQAAARSKGTYLGALYQRSLQAVGDPALGTTRLPGHLAISGGRLTCDPREYFFRGITNEVSLLARKYRLNLARWPLAHPLRRFPADAVLA